MEDLVDERTIQYLLNHPIANLEDQERKKFKKPPSIQDLLKYIELKEGGVDLPYPFSKVKNFPSAGILSLPQATGKKKKQLNWFYENKIRHVFIRPVYLQLFNIVWDLINIEETNVLIEGNPGVGKY